MVELASSLLRPQLGHTLRFVFVFLGFALFQTPAMSAQWRASGGYSVELSGYMATEEQAWEFAQTVAVGCVTNSGGLTTCFDPYEKVNVGSWVLSTATTSSWQSWRPIETRIPVRRTSDGINWTIDYEYKNWSMSLTYFCTNGHFTEDNTNWDAAVTEWPTCTNALCPEPECNPPPSPPPPPCDGVGNPCDPATGNKYQPGENDRVGTAAGLLSARSYNSQLAQDLGFGLGWSGLGVSRLRIYRTAVYYRTIHLIETTGHGEVFTCSIETTGVCPGSTVSQISLSRDSTGFTLRRRDNSVERYDVDGQLISKTDASGRTTTYTYNSGYLYQISGPYGHTQTLTWSNNHIQSITDASGSVQYGYDANSNLVAVTYPDGSGKRYHYENGSFPNHLTGISYVEASGSVARFSTYAYDSAGRASSTEYAGGLARFTLTYDSDSQTTVQDAIGTSEVMNFSASLGKKNLVSKINSSDGKYVIQTFDPNNNLTCRQDDEGKVTTFGINIGNQRESITEGQTGSCAAPQPTSATRVTNFSYVSYTLDAPTLIQSPSVYGGSNKTVTMGYGDSRFPTLPTSITQSGYTPTGTAISRSIGLGYNSSGQVTSINGPRTDVADITTLAYNTCTSGGGCGQLASVTNALGQVTIYDSYDGNGRLSQMTDANGLRTSYGYDARGRVTSITRTPPSGSARVTSYSYNTGGNLTGVSYPDGRTLTYSYSAAQKVLSVIDNLGNRVAYDYDPKGNRTGESVYDPSGTLVRTLSTGYDARNFVNQLNNGGSITQQVVDAIGNLTRTTDPNQVAASSGISTTHNYDALNRLIQTIDNLGGATSYGYNNQDRLTQVTAANGATTQYLYDDLGNLLRETSPDRGSTSYAYDAAGNVISQTDARGITTTYSYDALNRLTFINYPSDTDVTYTYDSGSNCTSGIGRLCQVADGSGTTQYGYDAFGNVLSARKTELNRTYVTQYTYDAGDRVTSITTPDNRVITYGRDALGRISEVNATVNGTSQSLVSNRYYRADGLFVDQTYGNGVNEIRQYNAKGELTYQSLGSADTRVYGYDANGNLTGKQSIPEIGSYTYDPLDRLTDVSRTTVSALVDPYRYDANGNRIQDKTGSYNYVTATNRLNTTPSGTLTRDAAGNTTNDGNGRTYAYNDAGHLMSATQGGLTVGTYTYNFQHQRSRKTANNATTVYHYDLAGNLIAETDGNGNLVRGYVYADSAPIAQIDLQQPAPYEGIVDNPQAAFVGIWPTSNSIGGYYGSDYRTHAKGSGKNAGSETATWTVPVPQAGSYQVYARWVADRSNANNAPYSITHSGGTATVTANQRSNGGTWNLLGTYSFTNNAVVTLTDKANGTVIADAIRLVSAQSAAVEVVRYLHTDKLGTPRVATNAQRDPVWNWEGEAFGNTTPTGSVTVNLRAPGQYYDGESGLFCAPNRCYDPRMGRWLQPDGKSVAEHVESWRARMGVPDQPPLELNPFAAVVNNPLRWIDRTGFEATASAPGYSPVPGAGTGSGLGNAIGRGLAQCLRFANPIVAGIVAGAFPTATGGCDDSGKCSDTRDDDDDGDDFCDERLAIELATCRALGNAERQGRVPPGSAAICYESAQARYWACKNKRPDPPFHGWPQH